MRPILICHGAQTRLWNYVSGRLSANEMQRVKNHVERCRSCREELGRVELIVSAISAQREQPIPASTTDFAGVARRIALANPVHRPAMPPWRLIKTAPVFVVLALAGLLFVRGYNRNSRPLHGRPVSGIASVPSSRDESAGAAIALRESSGLSRSAVLRRLQADRLAVSSPGQHGAIAAKRLATFRGALSMHHSRANRRMARLPQSGRRLVARINAAPPGAVSSPEPQSGALLFIAGAGAGNSDEGTDSAQPSRAFVMSGVGQDGDMQRTFVMDTIPTTTGAAPGASASADYDARDSGKAL